MTVTAENQVDLRVVPVPSIRSWGILMRRSVRAPSAEVTNHLIQEAR